MSESTQPQCLREHAMGVRARPLMQHRRTCASISHRTRSYFSASFELYSCPPPRNAKPCVPCGARTRALRTRGKTRASRQKQGRGTAVHIDERARARPARPTGDYTRAPASRPGIVPRGARRADWRAEPMRAGRRCLRTASAGRRAPAPRRTQARTHGPTRVRAARGPRVRARTRAASLCRLASRPWAPSARRQEVVGRKCSWHGGVSRWSLKTLKKLTGA